MPLLCYWDLLKPWYPKYVFLISINHPTLTVNKAKNLLVILILTVVGDTLQAHPPFLSWMKKKTIEYLFFEASQSVPIFEGNAHKPICARLEEELQLAVNITEWAKFKTKYWRFDAAAQVGFVLLWQAGPVKCGH